MREQTSVDSELASEDAEPESGVGRQSVEQDEHQQTLSFAGLGMAQGVAEALILEVAEALLDLHALGVEAHDVLSRQVIERGRNDQQPGFGIGSGAVIAHGRFVGSGELATLTIIQANPDQPEGFTVLLGDVEMAEVFSGGAGLGVKVGYRDERFAPQGGDMADAAQAGDDGKTGGMGLPEPSDTESGVTDEDRLVGGGQHLAQLRQELTVRLGGLLIGKAEHAIQDWQRTRSHKTRCTQQMNGPIRFGVTPIYRQHRAPLGTPRRVEGLVERPLLGPQMAIGQ